MPKRSDESLSVPFWGDEAKAAREGWLRANLVPKAAIIIGKISFLVSMVLNAILAFGLVKNSLEKTHVMVVRVNDVGRAEAVRLDTEYIPQEPELRDQLERFVIRYYTRNGFEIPEAVEALPIYLAPDAYEIWRKQAMSALSQVASGDGLRRVRILSCSVLDPYLSKTIGTAATIRIATDGMTPTGAFIPGKTEGWEITIRFKIGVYPTFSKNDQAKRDVWITRNPLGMKVLDIQQIRYTGADVDDRTTERVVAIVNQKVNETYKEQQSPGAQPFVPPSTSPSLLPSGNNN